MEHLKTRARELGLWNMFLPKNHFKEGAGFSNLEYGLMAEYLGKSRTASEATNCAAPDTGNMEVFAKYGTQEQKDRWLKPLLDGKIRSAFLMTEPDIASSDATNIDLDIRKEGGEYVLNGSVSLTISSIAAANALLLTRTHSEMVVFWCRRQALPDLHCHGQVRPKQRQSLQATIRHSRPPRHPWHHHPPHAGCLWLR